MKRFIGVFAVPPSVLALLLTITGVILGDAIRAQSEKADIKIISVNCQSAVLCEQTNCAVTIKNVHDSLSVQNIKFHIGKNVATFPETNCMVLSASPAASYPASLAPGQSVTVQVPYTPNVTGNVAITVTAYFLPPFSAPPSEGGFVSTGPNLSFDANPDDNVMSATISVAAPPPCDVEVQSINCGAQPVGGQQTNCDVTLKNNGPGKARNISVRIEPAAAPAPTPFELISVANPTTINQFASGQTQHLNIPVTFQEGGQINLSVTAQVSDVGGIGDSNPANNSLSATVSVALPNPTISTIEPMSGGGQTKATLKGRWFAKVGSQETPTVKFGTTPAVVSKVGVRELVVAVPCLGQAGPTPVTVTTSAGGSNNGTFTYTVLPLAIQQLSSTTISGGETLKISLTNANPRCAFAVKLGAQNLTITDQGKNSGGYTLAVSIPRKVVDGRNVLYVENGGAVAKKEILVQ
jgi:hypothetical protein